MYNVFTEEISNIALNLNDDKKVQSIDSAEAYIWNEQGFYI